jgi:hypothetical protein
MHHFLLATGIEECTSNLFLVLSSCRQGTFQVFAQFEASSAETNSRCGHLFKGQPSPGVLEFSQPSRLSRNTYGQPSYSTGILGLSLDIHIPGGCGGCDLTEVQNMRTPIR